MDTGEPGTPKGVSPVRRGADGKGPRNWDLAGGLLYFLLGFIGPKAEAEQIKRKIRDFLQTIGLTMSEEKTLITNAVHERARFLGYEAFTAIVNDHLTRESRALNGKVQLSVPQDVVRKWVTRYSHGGKPSARADLLNNSDYEIVLTYALELRGIANYYALAYDVSPRVGKVKSALTVSLVRTLANKHKISMRQVYRSCKRTLPNGYTALVVEVPREQGKPLVATYGGFPIQHQKARVLEDSLPTWKPSRRTEVVQRLLTDTCELCGAHEQVQSHHIRKLADLKRRYSGRRDPPAWVQKMIALQRKTLIVCQRCHRAIHNGTYDGRSLR